VIVSRDKAKDAAFDLEVELEGLTQDALTAAYRAKARQHHPDAGGDPAMFVRVDRAKHVLAAWLERVPEADPTLKVEDCSNCEGTGFIKIQRGFRALRRQCPSCYGSGEKGYERDKVFD
jgi:DnaJ-class molecular chaperone